MSKLRFLLLLTLFAVVSGIMQGVARSFIFHFLALDTLLIRCIIQAVFNTPVIIWTYFAIKKTR